MNRRSSPVERTPTPVGLSTRMVYSRHAGIRVDGEHRLGKKHGGRDAARVGNSGSRRRPTIEGSDGPGRAGVRLRRSGVRQGNRVGQRLDRPETPGGDRLRRSSTAITAGGDHPPRHPRSGEGSDRRDQAGGTSRRRRGGDPHPRNGEKGAVRSGHLGLVRPGNRDLPPHRARRDDPQPRPRQGSVRRCPPTGKPGLPII